MDIDLECLYHMVITLPVEGSATLIILVQGPTSCSPSTKMDNEIRWVCPAYKRFITYRVAPNSGDY